MVVVSATVVVVVSGNVVVVVVVVAVSETVVVATVVVVGASPSAGSHAVRVTARRAVVMKSFFIAVTSFGDLFVIALLNRALPLASLKLWRSGPSPSAFVSQT